MPKLRPRARIIRTIGDQLISGPEAALIELVKNSFDADSPFVNIKIAPRVDEDDSGSIVVADHGHGMSQRDVIEKWFEPATDEKLKRRTSPGGRVMLGAKGIGRFAAARLGRYAHLSTTNRDTVSKLKTRTELDIDWNWFDANRYLDQIEIDVKASELPTGSREHTGLILTIKDLRDAWTRKSLESLIRELRRVTSPAETREAGFSVRLDITAFTSEKQGFDGGELLSQLNFSIDAGDASDDDDPFLIRPFGLQLHADYILQGDFDKDGSFSGSFTVSRGDQIVQPLSIEALSMLPDESNCGPFSIKINIYDRETDAVENLFRRIGANFDKVGLLNARRILTENAGISIFRKGFRIRPYGEPDNDWLELERQRVQNPSRKLGLSQISGIVTVGDEDTSHLIERSSREGLEHTGSFERLKRLIQTVLIHAEERRFQFREKAGISRKLLGGLEKVRDSARLRSVSKVAKTLPTQYRKPIEDAIERDAAELALEIKEIDDFQQILQSRAALGLVLAEVLHEGRRLLNPVASSAKLLIDGKDWILEESKRGTIFRSQFPEHAQMIHGGVRDLGKLFKKLDPISGRRRGRPGRMPVYDVLKRTLDLFKDPIQEGVILVSLSCEKTLQGFGYEDDLQAALMNVVDNAIHWLMTSREARSLDIQAFRNGPNINVRVRNNGPIIDEAYVGRLFDAGFTLKSGGTGLGLAIAREALRRSKGDLVFDEGMAETSFVLSIPAAE